MRVIVSGPDPSYTYRIDKGPCETVPPDVEVIDPVARKSGYTQPAEAREPGAPRR